MTQAQAQAQYAQVRAVQNQRSACYAQIMSLLETALTQAYDFGESPRLQTDYQALAATFPQNIGLEAYTFAWFQRQVASAKANAQMPKDNLGAANLITNAVNGYARPITYSELLQIASKAAKYGYTAKETERFIIDNL